MRDIRRPCKNKDLAARNGKLLFTRDQIPESDYFKELELFEQNRIRLFNELDPVESRLNIPGKIIHLVHDMDRSGKHKNKYIPYWESLLSLREIELSTEVMVCTANFRPSCISFS